MIKIEAVTLEEAYLQASFKLKCSVTQLQTEVIQHPSAGVLGIFKKNAIIVAVKKAEDNQADKPIQEKKSSETKLEEPKKAKQDIAQRVENIIKKVKPEKKEKKITKEVVEPKKDTKKSNIFSMLNDTIMPASFVSTQGDVHDGEVKQENKPDVASKQDTKDEKMLDITKIIKNEINALFELSCFGIAEIEVSVYDENTILIEFQGEDSALLIGKEGYRYKALSYMLFNWINTKYQVQLRLEIAEFLKNQEESVSRYLLNVYEMVEKDGKAQTKILDGVLVQIALKELRDTYPDKYVAIRSTRDGLKYIIINEYLSHTKYE